MSVEACQSELSDAERSGEILIVSSDPVIPNESLSADGGVVVANVRCRPCRQAMIPREELRRQKH